jgi:PAS domain S-box-containing protein
MTNDNPSVTGYRRMTKKQLTEKMHELQTLGSQETEIQEVLHELEVYQIELEMQNRELRESREALEESLECYVNLYDFSPTGFVTLDSAGLVRDANLTLAGMLGVERGWIIGRSIASWILPSDLRAFRAHVRQCGLEEGTVTTELRFVRKDKTSFSVALTTSPSQDKDAKLKFFRSAITDISDRKKAEEERDRFFALSNDLLSLSGTDGYFKRVNPAWEKALGYTSDELLSRPYSDFIHPDDREATAARTPAKNIVSNPLAFQTRFMKKDGTIIWISWTSVLANDVYYNVARDTTPEHLEKIENENGQNWLRELVEKIPTPMILTESPSGNIISVSSGVTDLIGEIPVGPPFGTGSDVICEDALGNVLKTENRPSMRAARGEEFNGEQITWRTRDRVSHLRIFSRNIPAKYGRPAMALVTFQDITNLKGTEKSLLDAVTKLEQEQELRERFVSTLTHDLRTPLTAVKMGSELILRRFANEPGIQNLAVRVLDNIERMDLMIYDLLDANRISAGEKLPLKPEKCDLVLIAKKTLDVLTGIHGERFTLTGLSQCPLYVEPLGLRRVLENLCTNAVKYGDAKAPITIEIEKTIDKISISVHNEGTPIPIADQAILFKPFQRTSSAQASGKKGWGIGLTLIRGIVEAHGGTVRIVSADGEGTTFIVELPIAGDE